ncbi:glycosyl hydrolase family 95 catalytic domain-containing protein [Millionella massiliensis]|uniref:glycosyl hydrolase family 95 catalytic domain-containing protein n=1 Tax=Millionella massiliensis TaxID=1871023 RepID=UPI0023A83F0C|nr:hypothetical protein [Millionella massiliensis]
MIKWCMAGLLGLIGAMSCPTVAGASKGKMPDVKEIVSSCRVRFTAPPANIPATTSVDAPLLGNGYTGVALGGTPDNLIFYVARNDFWRLKSSYNESFPAVLGKIRLSSEALRGATYLVEQDLYTATTTATFEKEGLKLVCRAYVAAGDDAMALSLEANREVPMQVELLLPDSLERINQPPFDPLFPVEEARGRTDDGVEWVTRGFTEDVEIPTRAGIAVRSVRPDGELSRVTLRPGKPLELVCVFTSNFKTDDVQTTLCERVVELGTPGASKAMRRRHLDWWRNYWEQSYVQIPDTAIARQYYLSLYGTASCSRDREFPPSIFGSWITRERPAWNGDYHLNYNHSAPYYALYSANRIEQATPYYYPLLAQIERGAWYSAQVTGIPDGILLPVGIGPLGIETVRQNEVLEKSTSYVQEGNVECGGLFFGQKSNAAYCVSNLAMQFYSTYDEAFARQVWPFVERTATFWEKYVRYEDGRYVIYNDAIHEGTIGTMNPILSLGLVRMVMQLAVDMSEFLDTDAERRPVWRRIRDELADFPVQQRDGKTVFRYTERGMAWNDGNTLGIQHIYPAGTIHAGSDTALLRIARQTIDLMGRWLDFNGSNSFFPAAVRVGYSADTIYDKLRVYAGHTYPNGFQLGNPHGIENLSTVPNTVNEMLCSGFGGVLRLFPVWPAGQDAAFVRIRTYGAFLVSASIRNGEISPVQLLSEKGRPCRLENPWPGRAVLVKGSVSGAKTYTGSCIEFGTAPGERFTIAPARAK